MFLLLSTISSLVDSIPENSIIILLTLTALFALVGIFYFTVLMSVLIARLFPPQIKEAYQRIFVADQYWLGSIVVLSVIDLIILFNTIQFWLKLIEIPLSLSVAVIVSWIFPRLFSRFFDIYLLDVALKSKRKLNTELLLIGKFLGNSAIILSVIFIFAETHKINIFGLVASLGIGGLAVAFAAQKTLEQLLGGIVLYLDRPFTVDDYIGLPDGTFGRVESIGLRSTKIRTSGKGTLMIIPNSSLTQVSIENFTGIKKVISLIYLNFSQIIPEQEKALIRQVILESTKDIFGIDPRNTDVTFKDIIKNGTPKITQAQVNFVILGSGEVSMELRRQLLDVASQNLAKQLKEYGISFDLEDKIINVDSPITI
jgi:MscS family membrane protein